MNVTPKELFNRWQQTPWSAKYFSGANRAPFTPSGGSIAEETNGAPQGGGKMPNNASPTEMFARGLVAAEVEKRKLKASYEKKFTLARLMKKLAGMLLYSWHNTTHVSIVIIEWCGNLNHNLTISSCRCSSTTIGQAKAFI